MERITALLPMKGHSERVPNKNFRNFAGKPLFHAIMQTLLKSAYIDKIVIDTDSPEIKLNALEHFERTEIIDRPEEIQGDFISMNDIIGYDLSRLAGEHFLQTHSTNPLLTPASVDRAIESYFKHLDRYDSVFSVTQWQTRLYWKDGSAINHDPRELIRTQDLPPVFEENSNFYIFSRSSFHAAGSKRIGNRPFMYVLDKLEASDIDIEEDFLMAEFIYNKRIEQSRHN
jgi:CMP-N-acetylneuraminic acid synthetase